MIIGGLVLVVIGCIVAFLIYPRVQGDVKTSQAITSVMILMLGFGFAVLLLSTRDLIGIVIGVGIGVGTIALIIAQWKSMIGKSDEQIQHDIEDSAYLRGIKVVDAQIENDGNTRVFIVLAESESSKSFYTYKSDFAQLEVGEYYMINSKEIGYLGTTNYINKGGIEYMDISYVSIDKFKPANKFYKAVIAGALK